MKTGALDAAIKLHKYQGRVGWAIIFARVLLGYLHTHPDIGGADLIIPIPAVDAADHVSRIIQRATEQDDHGYPFRIHPPVII